MTLGKARLCMLLLGSWGDTASSQYDSFGGKMVLKRPFFGDTGEASALYIHSSGLFLGDRAWS